MWWLHVYSSFFVKIVLFGCLACSDYLALLLKFLLQLKNSDGWIYAIYTELFTVTRANSKRQHSTNLVWVHQRTARVGHLLLVRRLALELSTEPLFSCCCTLGRIGGRMIIGSAFWFRLVVVGVRWNWGAPTKQQISGPTETAAPIISEPVPVPIQSIDLGR